MDVAYVLSAFAAIFAMVNPVTKIIIFPLVTEGYNREEQISAITLAIYFSFLMFAFFGVFGLYIFQSLGVGINALRLTGGIILLKVGLDMVQGQIPRTKPTPEERDEVMEKRMVGIFPLAIPFIAGPASLITVMIMVGGAPGVIEGVMVLISTAVICIITLFFLLYSHKIFDRIGKVGVLASVRLMGMVLISIACQIFLNVIENLASTLT